MVVEVVKEKAVNKCHLVFSTPNFLSTTHLTWTALCFTCPQQASRQAHRMGLSQAGIPPVIQAPSWRKVQLVHIEMAAPDDLGIMHTELVAHHNVQKANLVETNGSKLDGVEQSFMKVVLHEPSR